MASDLFNLEGKTALITGGNSGLGLAYARGLAKHGADVVIWGRNVAKNRAAVKELELYGANIFAQQVDVVDEAMVETAFTQAVDRTGKIDCVIQNAGFINPVASTAEMSTQDWRSQLDVALYGGFFTLREAARHMSARSNEGDPGGSIILCGSGMVFAGIGGVGHYAAAKGGLAALMRCLTVELGPHKVRVNMIAPGYIRTDMVSPDRVALLSERTPLGDVGTPEDLEGAAVYLASDASRHHTGDILTIDGGWMASYY